MFEYEAVRRFVALKVPPPKIEFQSWAFSPILILMIIVESNAHVKQIQYMDDDDDNLRGSYHPNYHQKYLMSILNQTSRSNPIQSNV